nr:hypothetical protein [Tanacetum cinerariifolium]
KLTAPVQYEVDRNKNFVEDQTYVVPAVKRFEFGQGSGMI